MAREREIILRLEESQKTAVDQLKQFQLHMCRTYQHASQVVERADLAVRESLNRIDYSKILESFIPFEDLPSFAQLLDRLTTADSSLVDRQVQFTADAEFTKLLVDRNRPYMDVSMLNSSLDELHESVQKKANEMVESVIASHKFDAHEELSDPVEVETDSLASVPSSRSSASNYMALSPITAQQPAFSIKSCAHDFSRGCSFEGYVSHVDDQLNIYVQPKAFYKPYVDLHQELQECAKFNGKQVAIEPRPGHYYAVSYADDNEPAWYRALVESVVRDEVGVFYVDYGNRQTVTVDQLRPLKPQHTRLPAQAIKCALHGLRSGSRHISVMAVNQSKSLILEKFVVVEVVFIQPGPVGLTINDGNGQKDCQELRLVVHM